MAKPSKSNLRFIKDPALNPYYIQLDDYCYIAQKSTYSEAGHEYQNTIGHFSNLGNCLKLLLVMMLNLESYESLKEFVERFEIKAEELKNIN
jgi:hypothetical protein